MKETSLLWTVVFMLLKIGKAGKAGRIGKAGQTIYFIPGGVGMTSERSTAGRTYPKGIPLERVYLLKAWCLRVG